MRGPRKRRGCVISPSTRLTVLRVDRERVDAECRGGGAVWRVGYEDGTWSCSCPAKTTCSHLYGLWAVTVRETAA